MHKRPIGKTELFGRLAHLEAILCRLESDHGNAVHKNVLVAESIESARHQLKAAIKSLAENDAAESLRLSNIAWLHINFGRRLIDAETIEALLGEGVFLELTEDEKSSGMRIEQFLAQMEQLVLELLGVVKKQSDQ